MTESAPARDNLLTLICREVRQETDDIKTFSFDCDRAFAFEPGQALTFALEIDGERLYRVFSISSKPGTNRWDVTIKAHAGGRATPWIHANLTAGRHLQARPPAGDFTIKLKRAERFAFISAGSGATPLLAMLEDLAASAPHADVAWVHAARRPEDLLFGARLGAFQEKMPNLAISFIVSQPGRGWHGYRGRLNRRILSVICPDLGRRQVFCCGPDGFMGEIKRTHAAEGGDGALFHTESFGDALPLAVEAGVAESATTHTITIGQRILAVRDGESVLQASLRHGVIIPCGCGQGMCGTCRVRKLSGKVDLRHQGGITPEEEAQGYILACCSRPVNDIEISI